MKVEKIQINEIKGIMQIGTATIEGIDVNFCYDPQADRFTAIVYDKYKASGKFDEGGKNVPQAYLIGRKISKALKLINN